MRSPLRKVASTTSITAVVIVVYAITRYWQEIPYSFSVQLLQGTVSTYWYHSDTCTYPTECAGPPTFRTFFVFCEFVFAVHWIDSIIVTVAGLHDTIAGSSVEKFSLTPTEPFRPHVKPTNKPASDFVHAQPATNENTTRRRFLQNRELFL